VTILQKLLLGPNLPHVPQCEHCCGAGYVHGGPCLQCLATGLAVDFEDEESYFDAMDEERLKKELEAMGDCQEYDMEDDTRNSQSTGTGVDPYSPSDDDGIPY
jgi:hypothetical protein